MKLIDKMQIIISIYIDKTLVDCQQIYQQI